MKTGRMPENIWKRSVRKNLDHGFLDKEGICNGGTVVSCDSNYFVSEMCMVPMCPCMGRMAVILAANALAVRAKAEYTEIELMLDGRTPEEYVSHIAKDADSQAKDLGVKIGGFNVHVLPGLKRPYILATAFSSKEIFTKHDRAKPGQDIIITKWVALSGTAMIASDKGCREELFKQYPEDYINRAEAFIDYLSVYDEMSVINDNDTIGYISPVSETGIYGRLWNMAERSGVGFNIDLNKIPFRQETIEICNGLDIDPYILSSSGSLLITSDDGPEIIKALSSAGIPAEIIGSTTDKNDKLIINKDEERYLTKPQSDEIYRILG